MARKYVIGCLIVVLLTCTTVLAGSEQAYIKHKDGKIIIGNKFMERTLDVSGGVKTVAIRNKLTGNTHSVQSDEFMIELDNGANKLISADFTFMSDPTESVTADEGAKLIFHLKKEFNISFLFMSRSIIDTVEVDLIYELGHDDFYMRKHLVVRPKNHLFNSVEVERFRFEGAKVEGPVSTQAMGLNRAPWITISATSIWGISGAPKWLGQPIFIADELFTGLEYPAGDNFRDTEGWIYLRHYPGRYGPVTTRKAVIGVSPNQPRHRVYDSIIEYTDRIRAKPIERHVFWGSFVDNYHRFAPDRAKALAIFDLLKTTFVDRGMRIDGIHMNSPWDDQGIAREPRNYPEMLQLYSDAATRIGSALALHTWVSGRRVNADKAYLAERYDMIYYDPNSLREMKTTRGKVTFPTAGAYCLADPRAHDDFKNALLEHAGKYNISSYYNDWSVFLCGRTGHRGHMAGKEYGTEAIIDAYIDIQQALHREYPKLLRTDTCWPSPWWAMYYELVWRGVNDHNFTLTGPPAFEDKVTLEPSFSDSAIYGHSQQRPYFPLTDLMHFGVGITMIHPTDDKTLAGSIERLTDLVMINFMRGSRYVDYYVWPEILDDEHADALTEAHKWGISNDDILLSIGGRMFGGDPAKGQAYGFGHFTKGNRGLIGLRNPHVESRHITVNLDETSSMYPSDKQHVVEVVYPYRRIFKKRFRYGDKIDFDINNHEVIIMTITPEDKIKTAAIEGCRYEVVSTDSTKTVLRLFAEPGRKNKGKKLKLVGPANARITEVTNGKKTDKGKAIKLKTPKTGSDAKIKITDKKVKGGENSATASFTATIGDQTKASVVVYYEGFVSFDQRKDITCQLTINDIAVETEKFINASKESRWGSPKFPKDEAWTLFRAPLNAGKNKVSFKLSPEKVGGHCRFSCLILAETELAEAAVVTIEHPPIENNNQYPPPPYFQNIKRQTLTVIESTKANFTIE